MKRPCSLIFLLLGIILPPAYAGIGEDLMVFFKSAGMASNVTTPGTFQDQAAGFYSGGSIVTRNAVRNAQIATVQMPGFRAGCGGIDLWLGGFSHIKGGQIVETLRNIGSAAEGYVFLLGMQVVSSQIYNVLNEMNNLASQINQTNINTCEVAATAVGGVWPKSDQANKHLCQSMGSNLGAFSDWSAARQGCGAGGDRERVFRERGSDPRYKDMFVGEFNLAWKAIQANAFLKGDNELAQLFLTLVGSIIVRSGGVQTSYYKERAVGDKAYEVIDIVHDSVAQLRAVQVDDSHMERFLNQLRHARERITLRRNNAYQHMDSVLSFIQSTQLIEKQLHVMMGGIATETNHF